MSLLYDALKPVVHVALGWYYRSLEVAHLENIPLDGPVFLAANHPNSLTDAMVLGAVSPRRVRYTAKATLFGNPLAAAFLRSVGVVPLRRAADERAANQTRDGQTTDVRDAREQNRAGGAATSPDQTADLSRNAASFSDVANALEAQCCIAIFPEGITHDEPFLAPIRTGLARMALMARDERGVANIRIVPIGLLFEEKAEPRTRVLVQVGKPIHVDAVERGPDAVTTLTALISARLHDVTINFASHADAERIQLLAETLVAITEPISSLGEGAPAFARSLDAIRTIERARQRLSAHKDATVLARIVGLENALRAFHARLKLLRLNVHDIAISPSLGAGAWFATRELLLAMVLLPVSLWGRIMHFVPLRLARYLALRNVSGLDQPPMRTFINGLALVTFTYAALTTAVGIIAGPWWALLFLATLIPSASSDLRYSDRLRRLRERARAYRTFRRTPETQTSLLQDAAWLRGEAASLNA